MASLTALKPGNIFVMPGVPADWERPGPTRRQARRDVLGAVVVFGIGLLAWWLYSDLDDSEVPLWKAAVGLGLQCSLLAIRRTHPIIGLLVATVVFVAVSQWLPKLSVQLSFQGTYFASFYSAAAWAKDTRVLRTCATAILVVMAAWLVVNSTLFGAYQEITKAASDAHGLLPPFVAWMIYSILMNAAYFAGALLFGRRARAGAWQEETLREQAEQLKDQSAELARRAVVDERLRIARELHDVVAHHISAVGIQAAAARRVQDRDPATAASLLTQVESSARSALAETRALLGVLRSDAAEAGPQASLADAAPSAPRAVPSAPATTEAPVPASRAPEPGVADMEDLVDEMRPDIEVTLTRVEAQGLPLSDVPDHLGLTLYRVVQEALTNVRRHSTARSATVTLRTGRDAELGDWVEAEILDTGRPLPDPRGPVGSGYGLEGIRERASLHVGVAEIGPRTGSPGFRVRLRLPLNRPGTEERTA